MALTVEWIRDLAEFEELAPEWDALLPDDGEPFDLNCWYAAWWKAFGGGELAVCAIRRDGELAAGLPLRREGRELKSLVNGHSATTRPLFRDDRALDALVGAILAARGGGLELRGLRDRDPGCERIRRSADRLPHSVDSAQASPYVALVGAFDDWRKANKKRWKAPLEQKRRKMEREFKAEIVPFGEVVDLEAELSDGVELEGGGWKGTEGTAIRSSPQTLAFYRDVAALFQARGELRFSWIRLDDKAVAFDFCILYANRLFTLKSAYDEEFKGFAPGLVRQLAEIERCFELGIDRLELLGDEVGWKTRFASGNTPHTDLWVFSSGPTGVARRAYRTSVRPRMRSIYRRLRAERAPVEGRASAAD
jgi:CelD/BcsL family acetyltransferase involved in cellulose biosynthesis